MPYLVRVYTDAGKRTLPKPFRSISAAEVAAKVYLHRDASLTKAAVVTSNDLFILRQVYREANPSIQ